MRISQRRRDGRAGFTLVELMVAAALSVFIMIILTEAFAAGLGTFSKLKTIGDMQENLRATANVLKRDLAMPHFDDTAASYDGEYLSQQRLDWNPDIDGATLPEWQPPAKGFFSIYQLSPLLGTPATASEAFRQAALNDPTIGYVYEGIDGDGFPTNIARNHALHFTVKLKGEKREDLFSTLLAAPGGAPALGNRGAMPGSVTPPAKGALQAFTDLTPQGYRGVQGTEARVLMSKWAEVLYFLQPTGELSGGEVPVPTYTLRRRQKLLVDQTTGLNPPNPFPAGDEANMGLPPTGTPPPGVPFGLTQEISWSRHTDGTVRPNTPELITNPANRMSAAVVAGANLPISAAPIGSPGGPILQPLGDWPGTGVYTRGESKVGDDIVCENVISFEVKAMWDSYRWGTAPELKVREAGAFQLSGAPNPDFPFDDLPGQREGAVSNVNPDGGRNTAFNVVDFPVPPYPANPAPLALRRGVRVFDTWCKHPSDPPAVPSYVDWNPYRTSPSPEPDSRFTLPLRIRIKALQIRIRIWDLKQQQTRQVTIVQDM